MIPPDAIALREIAHDLKYELGMNSQSLLGLLYSGNLTALFWDPYSKTETPILPDFWNNKASEKGFISWNYARREKYTGKSESFTSYVRREQYEKYVTDELTSQVMSGRTSPRDAAYLARRLGVAKIPGLITPQATDEGQQSTFESKRGRPAKYDPDDIWLAIISVYDESGLPESQEKMIELVQLRYAAEHGAEPARTLLQSRIKKLFKLLG